METLTQFVVIESRSGGDPYEWDDYVVNTHPSWTLNVTFCIFYEGLGGGEQIGRCSLAPQQAFYLDGVTYGPNPTQYVKTEIVSVWRAANEA